MASADIIILSSSPPRQFRAYEMSPSPSLPSPSEIFQKKAPVLRTGTRATAIPDNASSSFTTAANLFRKVSFHSTTRLEASQSFDAGTECAISLDPTKSSKTKTRKPAAKGNDDDSVIAKPIRKSSAKKDGSSKENAVEKKPRKPRAKKAEVELDEDGNVNEKPSRKPRAQKAAGYVGEDDSTKEIPVRKPRGKKADGEKQTKIPKAQVTKSSTSSKSDKDGAFASKLSESTSRHFSTSTDQFEDSLDYGLAPAIRRRSSWTPPPAGLETELLDLRSPGEQSDCGNTPGGSKISQEGSKGFANLLESFAFNNAPALTNQLIIENAATRKRKLVELVKNNISAPTSEGPPAPKEKAIKKKPRTLTDLATSAYAPKEELTEKPAPILQYFAHQTTNRVASDRFKVPPKPRSKSPVKKSAKGTAQAPILLSPESALKQVSKQDFVFGTSSQLAREESPTFLRQIHAAMQASNEVDEDDYYADSILEPALSYSTAKGKSILPGKRNLWSAASRDTSGELMDVEMVDLVDSPVVAKQSKVSKEPPPAIADEEFWHDIDEPPAKPQPSQPASKLIGPVEAAIRDLVCSPLQPNRSSAPSPKASPKSKLSQSQSSIKTTKAASKPSSQHSKALNPGMPDFSAYTTAQLEKQVASYHFKPIKSRNKMITLLENCWEGKQRLALGTLGTNTIVTTSQSKESQPMKEKVPPSGQIKPASPKRPRGRPRNDSTTTSPVKPKTKNKPKSSNTVEYLEQDSDTPLSQIRTPKKLQKKSKQPSEDISDSDIQTTPSPSRRRLSQVRSRLLLQATSSAIVEDSPDLTPKSSEVRLFKYISRAITKVSSSEDPQNPTWHEKILLYDPIILEDLTVWLNTGALEKVGWDGEVEPKDIKKWCESKSICCLWKENLRGGARSRY